MDVKIFLEGQDITQDLEPFLIAVTYQDKLSGESDVIEFTLEDSKHKFLGEWFPKRGSSVNISIDDFDLGSFEVDEINPSYAVFYRSRQSEFYQPIFRIKSNR